LEELDLEREITHTDQKYPNGAENSRPRPDPVTVEEVDKKQQYFFSLPRSSGNRDRGHRQTERGKGQGGRD